MSPLEEALEQFDRVEANLTKAEHLWEQLLKLVPNGIAFVGAGAEGQEYRQLCRDFLHVRQGLPPVDEWRPTADPMGLDSLAQWRLDAHEIDEPLSLVEAEQELNAPGDELEEYRARFNVKRRQLVQRRIQELVDEVDNILSGLRGTVLSKDKRRSARGPEWDRMERCVSEIDRLLGTSSRSQAWTNLRRHLSFAEGCDLLDIEKHDWPTVKAELATLAYEEAEPLPVEISDLGTLVASRPSGPVPTALNWSALDEDGFERLLFAIISDTPGYENPQWLTGTKAPDRGRDLSVVRVRVDPLADTQRERIIIQCKHWRTKPVSDREIADTLTRTSHWEPPPIDVLVFATSGRFTADAVKWVEQHKEKRKRPMIEMWPENRLEQILARRPHLLTGFSLR